MSILKLSILIVLAVSLNMHAMEPDSLRSAIAQGNIPFLEGRITTANIDEQQGASYQTLLHIAVILGKNAVITFLLDRGACTESRNGCCQTPLHLAAQLGRPDVIELLLGRGARIEALTDDKETPLHEAALNNQLACARLLVAHGANVAAQDEDERTALDLHNFMHGWYPPIAEGVRRIVHLIHESFGTPSSPEYAATREMREYLRSISI